MNLQNEIHIFLLLEYFCFIKKKYRKRTTLRVGFFIKKKSHRRGGGFPLSFLFVCSFIGL
jgi:hypothetical protein